MKKQIICTGVKEYNEEYDVVMKYRNNGSRNIRDGKMEKKYYGYGRLVIEAVNEGGCNCVNIDLLQLLSFTKTNFPRLYDGIRICPKCCKNELSYIETHPPIHDPIKGQYLLDDKGVIVTDKTQNKIKVSSCKKCGVFL